MTITSSTIGPSNNAAGNVTLAWAAPVAGDLALLDLLSLSGQTHPATISGWTTVFANQSGGGYVTSQYKRVMDGTETGNFIPVVATTATIAVITKYHTDVAGSSCDVRSASFGGDSNDATDGLTVASGSVATAAGDWFHVMDVYALSTPSFPTVPAAASGRGLAQSGGAFGTIVSDASTTWQTNHRYNLMHAPVTTGATAAVTLTANAGTASMRGAAVFTAVREVGASNTAPLVSAGSNQVSFTTTAALDGTVTDNAAVSTSPAPAWTCTSVSDGGSLPSIGTQTVTGGGTTSARVQAPVTGGRPGTTAVFVLTGYDNGAPQLSGTGTMRVSFAGSTVGPLEQVSNTGAWTLGGGASSVRDALTKVPDGTSGLVDQTKYVESVAAPTGGTIVVRVEAVQPGDETISIWAAAVGTGTLTVQVKLYSGTTLVTTGPPPVWTLTTSQQVFNYPLTASENAAVVNAGDVRLELIPNQA